VKPMTTALAISTVAENMAAAALSSPDIKAAVDAAPYAMSIVVTDEESKQAAVAALVELQRGVKAAAEGKKPITAAIKRINAVVSEQYEAVLGPVAGAVAYLENQIKTRMLAEEAEKRRLARAEEIRQAEARKRAIEAERSGRPAPPPVPQRFIEEVRTTAKADGGRVSMSHRLKVEIANVHEVNPDFLVLAPGVAAEMTRRVASGQVEVPKDGTKVYFSGLQLWYEPVLSKVV